MMDILMPEKCWAHKMWNKIASDIKLVFYSSKSIFLMQREAKWQDVIKYTEVSSPICALLLWGEKLFYILTHFCKIHLDYLRKWKSALWNTTSASACNTDTTPTQPHRNSNTHRTKNNTTNVVIQQNSRKLLMMDILMSETCSAHKKWNKIASDIKLVFCSSTILGVFNICAYYGRIRRRSGR